MKIRKFIIIPENKGKPIKIAYEDNMEIIDTDDYTVKIVRRLTSMESEKFIKDLFGTTDVGILDCSDMSDEEIEGIVEGLNKEQFIQRYCQNCGSQRCEGIDTEWFDGCTYKNYLRC